MGAGPLGRARDVELPPPPSVARDLRRARIRSRGSAPREDP
jgi:hypothetical protein